MLSHRAVNDFKPLCFLNMACLNSKIWTCDLTDKNWKCICDLQSNNSKKKNKVGTITRAGRCWKTETREECSTPVSSLVIYLFIFLSVTSWILHVLLWPLLFLSPPNLPAFSQHLFILLFCCYFNTQHFQWNVLISFVKYLLFSLRSLVTSYFVDYMQTKQPHLN